MDFTIDDIFTKVCELEGLLAALRQHGDKLPDATLAALKRKADEVASMVNEIPEPEPKPAPAVEETPEPVIEVEPAPTVEETPEPAEEEPEPVVKVVPALTVEEKPEPVEEGPTVVMPPVFNPPVSEEHAPTVAVTAEPLRVSDKLHRTISKDLRRALSLNDRFRFARELFGNDVSKLDNALTTIEGMDTLEEAEAYLLGDLGLNADEETAAEFMTIVKNHYL